jgi:hypothetical protein
LFLYGVLLPISDKRAAKYGHEEGSPTCAFCVGTSLTALSKAEQASTHGIGEVMRGRQFYSQLSSSSILPSGQASKEWLTSAEKDGISLLTKEETDFVILYASFPSLLIVSVFGLSSNLAHPDKDELYNATFHSSEAWCIQRAWGGGKGHRMYLEPPLDFEEGHPLKNAEPIVFRRHFEGMTNHASPIELSQKLVHSLGLHFMPERDAFCRLNSEGDLEEVIQVFHDPGTRDDFNSSRALVLIEARPLAEYMAIGGYALYRKFDVTRFNSGFSKWEESKRHFDAPDLFYNAAVSGDTASYIHGGQILSVRLIMIAFDLKFLRVAG